jgi:hypothetical protein
MLDNLTMFIIISASISVIMTVIKKVSGEGIYKHPIFVRVQPLLPIVFGCLITYFTFSDLDVSVKMAVGVLAGACSAHAYKIFRQSIKAEDVRLRNDDDGPNT